MFYGNGWLLARTVAEHQEDLRRNNDLHLRRKKYVLSIWNGTKGLDNAQTKQLSDAIWSWRHRASQRSDDEEDAERPFQEDCYPSDLSTIITSTVVMHAWMGGRTDGQTDGCTDARMD